MKIRKYRHISIFSWPFLKLSTYHLKPSKGFSRVVKWTELKMWDQRKDRKLIILSKQANNIHTDKEKVQDIFKLKYLNMKNSSINQLNIFNIKIWKKVIKFQSETLISTMNSIFYQALKNKLLINEIEIRINNFSTEEFEINFSKCVPYCPVYFWY